MIGDGFPTSERARARRHGALVVLMLLSAMGLGSCRTSRVDTRPLAPIRAVSAAEAWKALVAIRGEARTLGSYATIRISSSEGTRSFRATLTADSQGHLRVSAFSPIGTELFTLFADGPGVMFADHTNRTWWKGSFSVLAKTLGLPDDLDAPDFAMLAFGLPAKADRGEAVDGSTVRQGAVVYSVSATGLATARAESNAWSVRYEPAAFPAVQVIFTSLRAGSPSISIRHLDAGMTEKVVEPLTIDPSYRCCVEPRVASSR